MPTVEFQYGNTPIREKEAAVVVSSLEKAGIKVKLDSDRGRHLLLDHLRPGAVR